MSWFSVTHLHVWMCMCRNAHLDDPHYVKNLNKDLYECFQEDISARIYAMGVTDAMEVGRRIKQLVEIFWGFTVAYDEGLLYEDSVLAAALWRNMYDCRPDVPIQELEALVRYIRRETLALDDMSDSDVLLGITYFKPPDYQPHESHSPVADNVQ
ncbi:hypothetical protein SARC_11343 [Sphaeroforma arctica JP610]|uniref:Ubiquinol-cytochrome c chaperone domain-containing protein n=1 Tax=Sphaeroforma arctica JP610 TaxID=667725 RepID=A0A0L0FI63_9EUKA|nr:hypothetical protein SARC_11343 [Sphaeroforma arctica JP610]KNC76146.1 hypothetical protein SARC_11343 [Sphaeroforma arctica JP610]|eukprot:XP_014150048.1 hypothetical protein SARC_11343 [Sphaeroforma arctica JP610]